jgi:hypothetical protein
MKNVVAQKNVPARKDVKRKFGILQVQFNINRGPTLG